MKVSKLPRKGLLEQFHNILVGLLERSLRAQISVTFS